MSELVNDASFNERMDKVNDIIDSIPELNGDDDDKKNTGATASDPASTGNTEPLNKGAIGEGQEKPTDVEKAEPQDKAPGAIEPPISWPADDKEGFKDLPQWSQELIVRRENEREAQFAERSRTIAAREKDLVEVQTRAQQSQQQLAAELQRVHDLAITIMPERFSDIKSKEDYLRLKIEDPQRANEFEAFREMLNDAGNKRQALQQQQLQEQLDREYAALQTKFPEFKDPVKSESIFTEIRKGAVDHYGFTPQEISVITDHRHVQVLRDAMAWKKHQANLKAAESKKVPSAPTATPTLRANGNAGSANFGAEAKNKIIASAGKATNLRDKADLLASLIN